MRSAEATVHRDAGADTVAWLLAGDPAIRWQALRDLAGAAPEAIAVERARVATEGWGARLLALQDPDGTWSSALYSPKWTSTTYTLLLLHWLGLPDDDARARAGCQRLWEGARFYGDGLTLAKTVREPETCITGMLVLLAARFGGDGGRLEPTLAWLLGQQLRDGGWNCQSIRSGSTHGSFHTTITVLEALDAVGRAPAGGRLTAGVADAAARGREFLLAHRLYRSHRTGAVSDPALLRWRFPPQWHYDVLRGLDHFAAVQALWDPRLGDALDVVRRARRPDGRWSHRSPYAGRMWFALERPGPSRWHTLRALRVLRWQARAAEDCPDAA
jgi:hypothetical protein